MDRRAETLRNEAGQLSLYIEGTEHGFVRVEVGGIDVTKEAGERLRQLRDALLDIADDLDTPARWP